MLLLLRPGDIMQEWERIAQTASSMAFNALRRTGVCAPSETMLHRDGASSRNTLASSPNFLAEESWAIPEVASRDERCEDSGREGSDFSSSGDSERARGSSESSGSSSSSDHDVSI